MTEESALKSADRDRWLIDPLDGTVNYASGYPSVCISIAFERAGVLELGVVYDPLLDELFSAQRGCGASLNGRAIRVSTKESLAQALMSSGFPYDAWTNDRDNTAEVRTIVKHTLGRGRMHPPRAAWPTSRAEGSTGIGSTDCFRTTSRPALSWYVRPVARPPTWPGGRMQYTDLTLSPRILACMGNCSRYCRNINSAFDGSKRTGEAHTASPVSCE